MSENVTCEDRSTPPFTVTTRRHLDRVHRPITYYPTASCSRIACQSYSVSLTASLAACCVSSASTRPGLLGPPHSKYSWVRPQQGLSKRAVWAKAVGLHPIVAEHVLLQSAGHETLHRPLHHTSQSQRYAVLVLHFISSSSWSPHHLNRGSFRRT